MQHVFRDQGRRDARFEDRYVRCAPEEARSYVEEDWFASPTRMILDRWKKERVKHARRVLKTWSYSLFMIEIIVGLLLMLCGSKYAAAYQDPVTVALSIYGYSRVNEIGFAFSRDALDRLLNKAPKSNLTRFHRIQMVTHLIVRILYFDFK